MRAAPILLLLLAGPALAEAPKDASRDAPKGPRPAGAATIACASLANYRILMRQAKDAAGAAAVLADPRTDHLGCAMTAREAVTGIGDHVVLEGRAYDCLALQTTSVCQWTEAGSIAMPAEKPARAGPQKPAAEPARPRR